MGDLNIKVIAGKLLTVVLKKILSLAVDAEEKQSSETDFKGCVYMSRHLDDKLRSFSHYLLYNYKSLSQICNLYFSL
jgi:hypothetical protein